MRFIGHIERDDEGASAVEYALLVSGIAAVIIILVFTLGKFVLQDMFKKTCDDIKDQASLGATCNNS
jgi:pilus assembly protein Flp/PilA